MYYSLIVFILSVSIGVFSSIHDKNFANLVLGDRYVSMTKRNIENNDPMAVYRSGTEVESFVRILKNNAQIDLLVFASGLLFSVFSTLILMKNGIMVGTFQYFFYAYGGFTTSVATIWLHGTIEIGTLILVGGAGLMAGKGLLFPGSYSRLQGFRISATRGVKLLIAILPFTILAAFIESFITRLGLPNLIKMMFVLLSLTVMVFYFVVYPYLKYSRKSKVHKEEENYIPPRPERVLKLNKIKTAGEMVMDTVYIYRKMFGKVVLLSIIGAVVYQLVTRTFFPEYASVYLFDMRSLFTEFFGLKLIKLKAYLYQSNVLYFRFLALLFALVGGSFQWILSRSKYFLMKGTKAGYQAMFTALLIFLAFHLFRFYSPWLNALFGIVLLSSFIFGIGPFYQPNAEGRTRYNSINLLSAGFLKILAMGLVFTIFGLLSFILASSPITFFNKIFIEELVLLSPEKMKVITEVFMLSTNLIVLFGVLPLFAIGAMLWRNSLVEQNYAIELSKSVNKEFGLE
jgi:uncharacterized membrane protein SpoIIM required for sporulation